MEKYWNYVRGVADELHKYIPGGEYTADQVVDILQYYYRFYEMHRGEQHPRLNYSQLRNIILKLPVVDSKYYDNKIYIEPEDYPAIIRQYFSTEYQCDYRINHFMSGCIREIKLYELEAS